MISTQIEIREKNYVTMLVMICFHGAEVDGLVEISESAFRWQLARGEGACVEGLSDICGTWGSQTTIEERPGYTLVQVTPAVHNA